MHCRWWDLQSHCNWGTLFLKYSTVFLRTLSQIGDPLPIFTSERLCLSNGAFPLHGTARYGSVRFTLGGFSAGYCTWYLVLFSTTLARFQAIRTVTKTWRVNSTNHWLAGENRHYCVTELAIRDPPLQPDLLDLNQHSQRRIGRNFCLNKCTFCINHKIAVSLSVEEVQMFLSLIAEERIQREINGATPNEKALCIFLEYVFCLYFYLCICVLLQLKTIWLNKCTSRLY